MGWPKIVGSYVVSEILGQGNYGEVRVAEHMSTKKRFAVKILPRQFLELTEYTADVRREMVGEVPQPFCSQLGMCLSLHDPLAFVSQSLTSQDSLVDSHGHGTSKYCSSVRGMRPT